MIVSVLQPVQSNKTVATLFLKQECLLRIKGKVSTTAHVQVINQKWSDVFKFLICETKWRQQAEDNPHNNGGRRNNSGRKKSRRRIRLEENI